MNEPRNPTAGKEAAEALEAAVRDLRREVFHTQATAAAMRSALLTAAAQFEFYEQQHRAKGTPEAAEKADVNRGMAAMCRTIAGAPAREEPQA